MAARRFAGLLVLCLSLVPVHAASFNIDFGRLTPSLRLLTDEDRATVAKAVEFIKSGNDTAALATLNTLTSANPDNSSLRILAAFASLRLGNLVGALDEARKAEAAPNGDSYKCLFLSRVALEAGDRQTCSRELGHAKNAGERDPMVPQIEKQLKKAPSKKS